MTTVLGIDIGGTKIAAGRVDTRAEVLECITVPTLGASGFEVSIQQVYTAIERVLDPSVRSIGICAPGPLNPKTGVILNPPNLPGWRNIPLAQLVSDRFHLPCRVENDANAAGLAEYRFGAAQGCASVLYVTISTGIGAGIILDGKIYHGKNGAAAEGGHVTIDYRSPHICNCGVPGCIEVMASGTAMARRAGVGTEEIVTANPQAFEESVEMIAAWLGSVVSLLDPDIIVIGGGVSQIGDPLFSRLRARMPLRTINQFASETPIVPAMLAQNVGVLGAATVALDLL